MPLGFALSALEIEGQAPAPDAERPQVFAVTVGPRYLETLALTVRRGRALSSVDGLPAQEGAVVNERFAARFFPATMPWVNASAFQHLPHLSQRRGSRLSVSRAPCRRLFARSTLRLSPTCR